MKKFATMISTPKSVIIIIITLSLISITTLLLQPSSKVSTPSQSTANLDKTSLPDTTNGTSQYQLHEGIRATIFWVGEDADTSNDYIHNRSSAWSTDWIDAYGGIDNPDDRCGHTPCAFTPKENPFYFALPFGDSTESGLKPESQLKVVPWYDDAAKTGEPLLKNRWIQVHYKNKTAYAQWEDVGPFEENDAAYVFGDSRPKEPRAGLDMSPALANYLGVDGAGEVDWRFVEETNTPSGPWKTTITRSKPSF